MMVDGFGGRIGENAANGVSMQVQFTSCSHFTYTVHFFYIPTLLHTSIYTFASYTIVV